MEFSGYDDIVARIAGLPAPGLIAIDGLPVSGKSTLADALQAHLGLDCIYLDDFVLPEGDWPTPIGPAFPFPYIRYDDFLTAVQTLASTGTCAFRPFVWSTGTTATDQRTVRLDRHVIVEGVSSLNPVLDAGYGLRIFVESDRTTTLAAALQRGVGPWTDAWRDLFLPSVDIYMQSRPQSRANLLYAGRGVAA